jgi:hypothetical protein
MRRAENSLFNVFKNRVVTFIYNIQILWLYFFFRLSFLLPNVVSVCSVSTVQEF